MTDGDTKITVKARPKDFQDVYFKWNDLTFKAGTAVTTDDEWAKVTRSLGSDVIKNAVCLKNPFLAQCSRTQE